MNRQWIALDTYFFAKPFPLRLRERFGLAGQMVFIAFLCACKENQPQGEITFTSDYEALHKMHIEDWPLVDEAGDKWTLDEFWTFTGRMKQTRRTSRGHVFNVKSTHFERWQQTIGRDLAAERQRRSRAKKARDQWRDNQCDIECDVSVTDRDRDRDRDKDLSPLPLLTPASDDTTSAERRGNEHRKTKDPLVEWVRTCVPGTGPSAARQTVNRLRQAGVGDVVIEEAAGYAAEHGAASARYVEQVARDWMTQRDPRWQPNG